MPAPVETPVLHADAPPRTVQQSSSNLPLPPNSRAFTIIRIALGCLLLTTAALKLSGGSNQAVRIVLPFLSPRLYSAAVTFELLLGVWLLINIGPVWSWLTSIGFFGFMAFVSFRLGWLGQSSCGCLGRAITLHPWWAFSIDVVALAALTMFRPQRLSTEIRAGVPTLIGGLTILACMTGGVILWYGSPHGAVAHLRGETVGVSPEATDLGTGKRGDFRTITLDVTNYHDKKIRIVGGTSDCSCIATDDLPIDVSPKETRPINVRVKFTGTPGVFRRSFVLFADDEHLRVVPVAVTGRVME
ncbi:MAG: MauE/DoxX family redox-associated membrane protein [Gemmataceae bacterium]